MKVICAGLAKTGTTSLAKALQVLGYNVYDFNEHCEFHFQQLLDSFETDRHPNFKEIYQGVDAVTDVPPQHFGSRRFQQPSQKLRLS